MLITQEQMDSARDNIYNAVWAIVKAEKETGNSGDEQEELSRAIIENDNLTFMFGRQRAAGHIIGVVHDTPELDQSAKDDLVATIANIYLRSEK